MADSNLRAIFSDIMQKLVDMYNAGDMKGIAEYYTEDCKIMAPGKETEFGRKAAEELHVKLKSEGGAKINFKIEECGGIEDGKTAYIRGIFEMVKEDDSIADVGKVLTIWEKVDGEYKVKIDCFNGNK
ncbi:uncharacterized protein LOC144438432 [Glandiceps talaboti]